MSDPIRFSIPFLVRPKQSDRERIIVPKEGGRAFSHHYQPRKVVRNQQSLEALLERYVPEPPLDGPLILMLQFRFPWLTSHSKKRRANGWMLKDTQPDCENLTKQVCDVMQGMGFFTNDSRIARQYVGKMYCNSGGLDVYLRAYGDDFAPMKPLLEWREH